MSEDGMQDRIKKILDEHFSPIIKDTWQQSLSIYDIGAVPDHREKGKTILQAVIVWVRSMDLLSHIPAILKIEDSKIYLDQEARNGEEARTPVRIKGATVMVRMVKKITTEEDGNIDLLIDVFQVFDTEDNAKACYEVLDKVTG